MKLEDIGFYTLEDSRAEAASIHSPLWRCEMILTGACNFKCPYCRQVGQTLTLDQAKHIVDLWAEDNLQNIRLSGGEPTIWHSIVPLTQYVADKGIKRIAISTNGSASMDLYRELIDIGVNDFSISLDACCASTGDMMAGNVVGAWDKVVANIKAISKLTYVTVGIVLTEDNLAEARKTIIMASEELGVADIRVIPSAQWNKSVISELDIPEHILAKHPILRYRFAHDKHVRGIQETDSNTCGLVVDDMAIMGKNHYPCIIYMREEGAAIGTIEGKTIEEIRQARADWAARTNIHCDPICKKNCLDVCIDYNAKYKENHE